ncbi:MAG: hypothetical protein JNM72_17760 [Deltaproteobacteria bacterium]|nr:hypothetical protein [Deltaproteobacteria bacterium]
MSPPRDRAATQRVFGIALWCAFVHACATPRAPRGRENVGASPPPVMLAPTLPVEAGEPPAAAPKPTPAPAAARLRHFAWSADSFLPDLQQPGSPTFVVLEDVRCTGCRVLDLALHAAVERDPALHVVVVDLGAAGGPGDSLRAAWDAEELPVAALFSSTGQQLRLLHGGDEIRSALVAHGQAATAVARIPGPTGFGPSSPPPPAAGSPAPAAAPAKGKAPATTQDGRSEEGPVRLAPPPPPKPPPKPEPTGWAPKPTPKPPPPPEDGPRLGPADDDAPEGKDEEGG